MAIKYLDAKRLQGTNAERLALSTSYDIDNMSFVQYMDYSSYDARPHDVQLKPDGTKMYVMGYMPAGGNNGEISQFTLATPYDISTASLDTTLATDSYENDPTSLFIDSSGTRLIYTGRNAMKIHRFTIGDAWDLSSTITHVESSGAISGSSIWGLTFKPDGTKLYLDDNYTVSQYDISAWDISGLPTATTEWDSSEDSSIADIEFNSDGSKMFAVGWENDRIYQYSVTSYALSSASYDDVYFQLPTDYLNASGFGFSKSGQKLYMGTGEATYDRILEYNTGSSPNLQNGTIFNETDTYKYFMWNGTDTWNQMVSS